MSVVTCLCSVPHPLSSQGHRCGGLRAAPHPSPHCRSCSLEPPADTRCPCSHVWGVEGGQGVQTLFLGDTTLSQPNLPIAPVLLQMPLGNTVGWRAGWLRAQELAAGICGSVGSTVSRIQPQGAAPSPLSLPDVQVSQGCTRHGGRLWRPWQKPPPHLECALSAPTLPSSLATSSPPAPSLPPPRVVRILSLFGLSTAPAPPWDSHGPIRCSVPSLPGQRQGPGIHACPIILGPGCADPGCHSNTAAVPGGSGGREPGTASPCQAHQCSGQAPPESTQGLPRLHCTAIGWGGGVEGEQGSTLPIPHASLQGGCRGGCQGELKEHQI